MPVYPGALRVADYSPGAIVRYFPEARFWTACKFYARTNHQCGFGGGFLLGAMPRSAMMALFASRHRLRWRLYSGAREALEAILTDRLHLGWRCPNAAEFRAAAKAGGSMAKK